jgi:hypothetical protein
MTKIWTAQDAVSIVLDRTTSDFRLRLYQSRAEKWCFWVIVASFVGASGTGLYSWIRASEDASLVAVLLFYISASVMLLYQVLQLLVELGTMKNPEKKMAQSFADAFNHSMDLIQELSGFEHQHLSYAKSTFEQGAKQLRERIAVLVGALDKVGVIPLVVTTYLSYAKVTTNGFRFGFVESFGLVFIVLYIFSIRMLRTAQWMEAVADLYAHAIEARKGRGVQWQ